MISTPKLPFRIDTNLAAFPRIVNDDGWVASAAENRVDFIVAACNYHERLRDVLQDMAKACPKEAQFFCVDTLLAELAKAVQP